MKYLSETPDFLSLGWTNMVENLIIGNILNSMSDGVVVIDSEGEVLYANRVTQDILGFSLQEFKEHGLAALLLRHDQNHHFNRIFSDAVEKKCINEYQEVDYRHPGGTMKRLAVATSYLLADGEYESTLIGFVAVFKDVTEVFNLRRSEQELLREKQRIAHEKVKSLQRLAMGVAHEIRNPVVTIGGFAGRILRNHDNPPETRDYAEKIREDARKLEGVVDDVQRYCNLPELRASEGDIVATVSHAVSEMIPKALERNIQFDVRNNMAGHRCVFDAALIRTALVELVENAIDFSEEGSTVSVSVYRTGDGTVLEVADSGYGIDIRDRDYIFDPFFSTKTHASGMGLSIVERIVHEHLGRIEVDSDPAGGTAVRIVLPECFF